MPVYGFHFDGYQDFLVATTAANKQHCQDVVVGTTAADNNA